MMPAARCALRRAGKTLLAGFWLTAVVLAVTAIFTVMT